MNRLSTTVPFIQSEFDIVNVSEKCASLTAEETRHYGSERTVGENNLF